MAIERNPNDPYQASATNDEMMRRRAEQIDAELQTDPELAEGPASGGRIALFAIALVAILGVVFYGLNSSPNISPETTPTAQTTTSPSPSAGGMAQSPRPPAGQTTGSSMTPAQPRPSAPAAPQNSAPANGAPSSN